MHRIPMLAALVLRALQLDGDAYWRIKTDPLAQAAAGSGGRLVALVGVALGLAELARTLLGWAVVPDLADVQRVLAQGAPALPLLGRWKPEVERLLAPESGLWALGRVLWPTPTLALVRAAVAPLAMLVGWLVYGYLAHRTARWLGGGGALGDTLRCLALAEAPWLALLCPFVPARGLGLLGMLAWVMAGRWLALRAAHGLGGWRAFWAALGPLLLAGWIGLGLPAALALLGRAG